MNHYICPRSRSIYGVYREMSTLQKTTGYVLATVLMTILLGSALAAPTFSAYAAKPTTTPPVPTPPVTAPPVPTPPVITHPVTTPPVSTPPVPTPPVTPQTEHDDDHKKGKKDPDSDKDKDTKTCKHGDTTPNGKYRHNCDSDQDFK